MLRRTWLTLPAGFMWAMTCDTDLTEEVQTDPKAFEGIALRLAARLAYEKVRGRNVPTHFAHVLDAWCAMRDLIADEKLIAEGQLIERHCAGLHAAVESFHVNAKIPSGEAANLILLDNDRLFDETVLAPDELYRFHNGQGRYWKRVRLSAADLQAAFPPAITGNLNDSSEIKQRLKSKPPSPGTEVTGSTGLEHRRGRKKGSGSYADKDAPLVKEMRVLLKKKEAFSVEAAAAKVASKAHGAGTIDSKRDRLAKRYQAKFNRNIARNKSD